MERSITCHGIWLSELRNLPSDAGDHVVQLSVNGMVVIAGNMIGLALVDGGVRLTLAPPRPAPTTVPSSGVLRREGKL